MKTIYSIGETAKTHGISKQTLIYYDRINLLKPHHSDPKTGYRYYSMEEFATLDVILLLKEIGVPLNQIKDYLDHRDINSSIALFQTQEQRLEQKIRALKQLQDKIKNKLLVFSDYEQSDYEEDIVFMRKHPPLHIIEMEIDEPGELPQLDIAMKKLMQYMRKKRYVFNYQVGTTVKKSALDQGEYQYNQTIFTIVDKPLKDPYYRLIEEASYTEIYFKGNYDSFEEPYEKLLNYIKTHKLTIIGPAYELNISDMFSVRDRNEYITEIRIPVMKK